MAHPPSRQDHIAGRLAVGSNFCSQAEVDKALQAIGPPAGDEAKFSLAHILLRQNSISATQFRLLNMGVRYELNRDADVAMARFLVKNKYLSETKVREAIAEQDPYYREGKDFPRLDQILVRNQMLTQSQIDRARRQYTGLKDAVKQVSSGAGPIRYSPMAEPSKGRRTTLRADLLALDHCRVVVKPTTVRGPDGAERKVDVLSISGQLDAHSFNEFDLFLKHRLGDGDKYLVLEMQKLEYISSAGLGVLATTARSAREVGGDVRLAAVPPEILGVMSMVGLEKLMKFYSTAAEGVASFKTA